MNKDTNLDRAGKALRLGFACIWDSNPRRTWSYTPWDLREALRRRPGVEVVDIGFTVPNLLRRVLQLASLKRRAERWVTPWKYLRVWESALEYELNRRANALGCDVVLQIQDLGATSRPFLIYQDFSYDVILDCLRENSLGLREYFPHLDAESIRRLRARQVRIYGRATRLLTMSEFLRRSLIESTKIDPTKVVTVLPGVSAADTSTRAAFPINGARRISPRRRLLFIGTTFLVKGGDVVLAALALLRRRYSDMTLTIVGPSAWPGQGQIPEGVRFLGRLDPEGLPELYRQHDLLVVPSRLEGFGKVFVEALSHGLPCIGRRAFAMPELIEAGVNGDLVESDNPEELARRIDAVLASDAIYANCRLSQSETVARFNWDRAAADVVNAAMASISVS
jgi:glycosyltransferase involved in cell wall biosynthesis